MFKAFLCSKSLKKFGVRSIVLTGMLFALVWWFVPNNWAGAGSHYDFYFTASGDFGVTDEAQESLGMMLDEGSDFHLALGDLAYGGNDDSADDDSQAAWCDFVTSAIGAPLDTPFPFEIVSGNHDDDAETEDEDHAQVISGYEECLPHRLAALSPSDTYGKQYYFDYPGDEDTLLARFIMISPGLQFENEVGALEEWSYEISGGVPTEHYTWLEEKIDDAREAGIPWIIVGMHENCITVGEKGCSIDEDLMNLLFTKRVDLILQAHDHTYQRSKQLTCATAGSFSEACVSHDGAGGVYPKGEGSVLVIAGTGGKDLYGVNGADHNSAGCIPDPTPAILDSEAEYFATWMGCNTPGNRHGFVKFSVADNELKGEFMGITSTGGTFTDEFRILGEGATPTPIDSVLVLDRSFSMDQDMGGVRKIDALQPAANLYLDLLRGEDVFDAFGEEGIADRIGLVRYNEDNWRYLDLGQIDDPGIDFATHLEEAQDRVSPDATTDPERLLPSGSTWIGGAVRNAATMFRELEDDRAHIMIVLTDGKENRTPYVDEVLDEDAPLDDRLRVYSVGLGEDEEDINVGVLERIAENTGGYLQVTDDLSGESVFDLESFYFKIFADATEMEFVADPTALVPLAGTDPIVAHRAFISSSDRQATFLVLDDPDFRERYNLELVAPSGVSIRPTEGLTDLGVQYLQRYTYALYRVTLPENDPASSYVGEWKVLLTPKKENIPLAHGETVTKVPIGFAVGVLSSYHMDVDLNRGKKTINVTAKLTNQSSPVTDARVLALITDPQKQVHEIVLYDDGNHADQRPRDGIFSGSFPYAKKSGSYRVLVKSQGSNEQSEMVSREASRFVYVPAQRLSSLIWFLVIIILGLLVLCAVVCCWKKVNIKKLLSL